MRWPVLFGVALLTACASAPPTGKREDAELERLAQEVSDEVTVGRQIAAKLLGHFGAFPKPKVEEYVRLVGGTLVRRIGRPELKFHFGVLKSPEINAFATPGGYLFVTSGLLQTVRDGSELAGVLAHEIAHVNERHMVDQILPRRDATAGSMVVGLLSRGRSTMGVSLTSVVNRGMEMLLEKGMSEEQEVEADRAAVAYTAACGYNPRGLLNLLERTQSGKFGKANRPSASRMAKLSQTVAGGGVLNHAAGDERVMQKRFTAALSQAVP